jgi:hypothetical protein
VAERAGHEFKPQYHTKNPLKKPSFSAGPLLPLAGKEKDLKVLEKQVLFSNMSSYVEYISAEESSVQGVQWHSDISEGLYTI